MTPRALELLRLAHLQPGLTRARAANRLGVTSGTVTELVGMLVSARLLDERPARPTGRGRPTRELVAHPGGPLVLAGVVDHENWRIAVTEIGGTVVAEEAGAHGGKPSVETLRGAAEHLSERFPARVRGMGLALPGVVRNNRLVHAPLLDWRDLDLTPVWPGLFVPCNDATLAAVGEARRGAARDAALHLHLHLDAGLGGAVTRHGAVLSGAHGVGGEYGHMPLGDRTLRCPCGARGCWTMSVGAEALARTLGEELPQDALTYLRTVLDRADAGEVAATGAVAAMADSLGSGIAGLVNGLDADLVTIGGLAPRLAGIAPAAFADAYTEGLMSFRRAGPPPIRHAALGAEATRTGAAEQVWSRLWDSL